MLAVRNRAQSHDALQRFSLSEYDDPSRVPVDADAVTRTPSAAILFCSFFSFNMFVSTSPLGRCSITTITTCSHLHTFHVLHDDPFRMVFFKKSFLFKDDYNFWLLSLKTFSITFVIRNVILRVESQIVLLSLSSCLYVNAHFRLQTSTQSFHHPSAISSASGRLDPLLMLLVESFSHFAVLSKIWGRTPILFRRLQFPLLLGMTSNWCSLTDPWSIGHCPPAVEPSLAPSSHLCDPYLVWLFLICDPYSKFHLIAALCLQSRVYATIESGLIGSDVIGCDF